ncbi:MAG: inverse autotransporter beta domain-containing protein [Dongiaceae bacterium]
MNVRLRSRLLVGAAAVALVAPGAGKALAQEAKWQPWLEAGGMVGTNHSFGDVDIFVPIWQDQTSLLFGDFRGTFSSQPTQEGNFGLGYRTQVDPSWILGGYGYFDIQNSENDNLFYQATLGLEALSVDWDFRVNGYIPFNAGARASTTSTATWRSTATRSGSRRTARSRSTASTARSAGVCRSSRPTATWTSVRSSAATSSPTRTSTRSRPRGRHWRFASTTSTSWACSRA